MGGDVHKDELLSCCTEEERVLGMTDQRWKPGKTSLSGEMKRKQKKKKEKEQAQLRKEVGDFSGGAGEARESDATGAVKQGRRTSQREASGQQCQRQPGSRDRRARKPPPQLSRREGECGGAWSLSVERLGLKAGREGVKKLRVKEQVLIRAQCVCVCVCVCVRKAEGIITGSLWRVTFE